LQHQNRMKGFPTKGTMNKENTHAGCERRGFCKDRRKSLL
jgi:hypothetical protein